MSGGHTDWLLTAPVLKPTPPVGCHLDLENIFFINKLFSAQLQLMTLFQTPNIFQQWTTLMNIRVSGWPDKASYRSDCKHSRCPPPPLLPVCLLSSSKAVAKKLLFFCEKAIRPKRCRTHLHNAVIQTDDDFFRSQLSLSAGPWVILHTLGFHHHHRHHHHHHRCHHKILSYTFLFLIHCMPAGNKK